MTFLKERLENVVKMRSASTDPNTRKLANQPYLFRETNNYATYIIIPSVSSVHRHYIPMGFLDGDTIPTNLVLIIPGATLYHFGILTSNLHMAWVRAVCGRLESRYRYSKDIVYNNFPWPQQPNTAQVKAVEEAAQAVLDARDIYLRPTPALPSGEGAKGASLADLYDPLTMPKPLRDAHQKLDRAVDKCYRAQPFANDAKRVEFLFELYEELVGK